MVFSLSLCNLLLHGASKVVLFSYPVLSLHNYLAIPSPYCASRIIDEELYRTPSLFLHTLPHREYCIRHPSTWHTTKVCVPKLSLNDPFPNLQSISALSLCNPHRLSLHSVDIFSCLYTLCIRLITCQTILLPNTYKHLLESLPFTCQYMTIPLQTFFIRDNVTLQYLIPDDSFC